VGFAFTPNLSFELGFHHIWSSNLTANQKNYYTTTFNNTTIRYFTPTTIDLSARMYRLNPAVLLSTDLYAVKPFARFGLLVGWGSITYDEKFAAVDATNDENLFNGEQGMKMDGDRSWGLSADLGLEFKLLHRLSLIAEMKTINMNYTPAQGKMYKAKNDDRDVLSEIPINQKEFEYLNSVTSTRAEEIDTGKPTRQLKSSVPFSSIGFNIGLKFSI